MCRHTPGRLAPLERPAKGAATSRAVDGEGDERHAGDGQVRLLSLPGEYPDFYCPKGTENRGGAP